MNKKRVITIFTAISAISILTTGCGKVAKLKNGEEAAVKINGGNISANKYYEELKEKNISTLVDMIDHKLFDKKYPSDDKEKKAIDDQITQMKKYYTTDDTFNSAIQQYFGVNTEEELRKVLSLEYKRNLAVKDYIKSTLTDKEIKDYYDNNVIGDIKASHILIKVDAKDDATDEEKKTAEENALKKAKNIIKKLDDGKDFAELAKKYSNDTGSANDGGNLGYFSSDEMDEDFMTAVKSLKNKEYTKEPVKTQYGYHIILKVDQKEKKSLKEAKSDIKNTLTENKISEDSSLHYKSLIKIREQKKIKFEDQELEKSYNDLMEKLIKNATSTNTSNS